MRFSWIAVAVAVTACLLPSQMRWSFRGAMRRDMVRATGAGKVQHTVSLFSDRLLAETDECSVTIRWSRVARLEVVGDDLFVEARHALIRVPARAFATAEERAAFFDLVRSLAGRWVAGGAG